MSKKLLFGATINNDTLYNSCTEWLREHNFKINGKISADSLKRMIEKVEVSLKREFENAYGRTLVKISLLQAISTGGGSSIGTPLLNSYEVDGRQYYFRTL